MHGIRVLYRVSVFTACPVPLTQEMAGPMAQHNHGTLLAWSVPIMIASREIPRLNLYIGNSELLVQDLRICN